MPKRLRRQDPNVVAFHNVKAITEKYDEPEAAPKPRKKRKNAAAVALGRKGGKIGGRNRAANMTAEQRSEAAREAARVRWAKRESTE
jgi:hypothetical protein